MTTKKPSLIPLESVAKTLPSRLALTEPGLSVTDTLCVVPTAKEALPLVPPTENVPFCESSLTPAK